MKIEVDIFRIAEKTPDQDEYVLIKRCGEGYWTPKVYNAYYNCWDTEDRDDYDSDVDENDIWMRLPDNIENQIVDKIK